MLGAAGVELCDLIQRNVEACHLESFAAEEQRQRQTDIAHSDDADAGLTVFYFLFELRQTICVRRCPGDDCTG